MTNTAKLNTPKHARFAALLLFSCANLFAAELGGVAIHGSVSLTAGYSPDYNYLGDTKSSLDHNQTEIILNGTKRFENGLKLAAQIYAYELAGYEDLTLDFANVDYLFNQGFGIRLGRNKLPFGLYNEAQDLDQIRVFASLPLNFYPRAQRPFGASFDGGQIYGNVDAGKAGSFDYQVFYGMIQPLDENMPFMRGIGASHLELDELYGTSFIWNMPVEGVRVGYSVQTVPVIGLSSGPASIEVDYSTHAGSIEYSRGKWILAAEYKYVSNESDYINFPLPNTKAREDHSYAQVTYQATDKLGVGTYYAYSDYETNGVVKDLAFATSYSLTSWWLLKAEIHAIDGIGYLTATGNAGDFNPSTTDATWTYFLVKSTVSF